MMKRSYFMSALAATLAMTLSVCFISCGDDGPTAPIPTPTPSGNDSETIITVSGLDAPFAFDAQSASQKQVMQITTNAAWAISSKPEWLDITPQSGQSGTTSVEVWPNKENTTASDRTGEIVIQSGDKSITKKVTQRTGYSSAETQPTNVLVMCDGIAMDFSCNGFVAYYDYQIMRTTELSKYSDKELAEYVRTSTITSRKTPADEWIVSTTDLNPNTSYTIVTVSYDKEGKQGKIVKQEQTTKSTTNYPYVYADNLQLGQSGDNYYLIWDMVGNTYVNKYYTWVAMAKDNFLSFNWGNNLIAWFVYKEIKANASSHDTKINSGYGYTTYYEHLEGPQLKTGTEVGSALFNLETKYIQILSWATDQDNNLAGVLNNWTVNLNDNSSAPKKMLKQRNRTEVKQSNGQIVYSGISKKQLYDNVTIQRIK